MYYKIKLELKLKSNSSEILPFNCKFISFVFMLKGRLKDLKFEFYQVKLE